MNEQIRVGDVVAWADVPDGALVRFYGGKRLRPGHALRIKNRGTWVEEDKTWYPFRGVWEWAFGGEGVATIVALNRTGQESADDLQRLAEVFEVREYLINTGDDSIWYGQEIDELAPRLHAAGWRAGMPAEDAARMLAEAKP